MSERSNESGMPENVFAPAPEPGTEPEDDGAAAPPSGTSVFSTIKGWLRGSRRLRNGEHLRVTIGELIEEQAHTNDVIQDDERALLRNILQLHGTTVEDVLVPRADINAIDKDASLEDLVKRITESGHSRLPVYRDSLDDIIGVIHIKDVVSVMRSRRKFRLQSILREVLYVVPWTPVLDLLLEMRTTRKHMAIVIDEFGGTDGLVTIEDLVEEIVGEIRDEHDETEEPRLQPQKDGSAAADARVPVSDLEQRYGPILTEDEREDTQTLGGLVFMLAGRVPARGELIRHSSGIEFEVVEVDSRRIKRLRLRNLPAASE